MTREILFRGKRIDNGEWDCDEVKKVEVAKCEWVRVNCLGGKSMTEVRNALKAMGIFALMLLGMMALLVAQV